MAKPRGQRKKVKGASSKTSQGRLKRYLIYGVIAAIALAAAVFLTRDNKKSTAARDPRENAAEELAPIRTEFLKEGMLSFYTASSEYITTIDIELAENNDERRLGMMFRKSMGDNQGMFFIFPYDDMQSFWMKNTILPLDMLFINSANEIVTIHKNTTPYAETTYPSTRPAKFVLEVNAGFADRVGIREGDKIGWMRTN
jgi:uncharacterized membrane protein (UPF0127 family)